MDQMMTKQEFWKTQVPKALRSKVLTGAIFSYVSGAITAVAAVLYSPMMFLDVVLILGLGLGIHLAKSRVCSVLLLVYYIISKVIQAMDGSGGGYVMVVIFIVAYISSVIGTIQFQKMWKQYREMGGSMYQTPNAPPMGGNMNYTQTPMNPSVDNSSQTINPVNQPINPPQQPVDPPSQFPMDD